jgi:hypothetical protein
MTPGKIALQRVFCRVCGGWYKTDFKTKGFGNNMECCGEACYDELQRLIKRARPQTETISANELGP